jgi:hypothetical protein
MLFLATFFVISESERYNSHDSIPKFIASDLFGERV